MSIYFLQSACCDCWTCMEPSNILRVCLAQLSLVLFILSWWVYNLLGRNLCLQCGKSQLVRCFLFFRVDINFSKEKEKKSWYRLLQKYIGWLWMNDRMQYFILAPFWLVLSNRWAAKVLVNSNEACDHGRKVGNCIFLRATFDLILHQTCFSYGIYKSIPC